MDFYLALKHLHVACVVISVAGFAARFALVLKKSALMERRWMRIVPHVNDTLLLAAAIALTATTAQYPFVDGWLTAKVFGLIAYIILGSVALKAGRTPGLRLAAGFGALAVFGYVATVALHRSAWGPLAGLLG